MQALKEQLASEYDLSERRQLAFTGEDPDPFLEIKPQDKMPDGWVVMQPYPKKVLNLMNNCKVNFVHV